MPNLAAVIKAEIQRLNQKGIRQAVGGLKSEIIRLRKDQAAMRKEIAALKKAFAKGLNAAGGNGKKQAAATASPAEAGEGSEGKRGGVRPTGKSVRALREKFGMSQDEFSRLTGVGRVTIARWEAVDGRVQFRGKGTRESFGAIMKLGKKEAWAKIGGKPVTAEKSASATPAEKTPAKRGRKRKLPAVVVLEAQTPADAKPAAQKAKASGKAAAKRKTGKVTRKRA